MSEHAKFRVLLVDDDAKRLAMLEQALAAEGHTVVSSLDVHGDLSFAASQHRPEVICIDVDAPGRNILASLAELNRKNPRPVLLFTAHSDAETTRLALEAGVSAYVVQGLHLKRLSTLLQVAIARFDLYQDLRHELDQARTRLADIRDIEKAKGLIMKRRKLDEAAAYSLLRRMAMDRKQRLGDYARLLLGASDVLGEVSNDHAAEEDLNAS